MSGPYCLTLESALYSENVRSFRTTASNPEYAIQNEAPKTPFTVRKLRGRARPRPGHGLARPRNFVRLQCEARPRPGRGLAWPFAHCNRGLTLKPAQTLADIFYS